MRRRLATAGLLDVAHRLDAGVRLDLADGVSLFECPDLHAVGWLATRERERRHGARTFFNHNIRLEATNVCVASCLFCSFARLKEGDLGSYTMSLEQAWGKLRQRAHTSLTEVHIVNGLHPSLPFGYYTDLLRGLKQIRPDVHLKAFTAVEVAFFADLYGMTDAQVLRELMARSAKAIVDIGNALMRNQGEEARASKTEPGLVEVANLQAFEPTVYEREVYSGDEFTPAMLRLVWHSH